MLELWYLTSGFIKGFTRLLLLWFIPLLSFFTPAKCAFVDGMAEVKVRCEEVIMRQNDKGNNFYLIKEGTCDVWVADASGLHSPALLFAGTVTCGSLGRRLARRPRAQAVTERYRA